MPSSQAETPLVACPPHFMTKGSLFDVANKMQADTSFALAGLTTTALRMGKISRVSHFVFIRLKHSGRRAGGHKTHSTLDTGLTPPL